MAKYEIPAGSTTVRVDDLLNWIADTVDGQDHAVTAADDTASHQNRLRRLNVINGHFWRLRDMAGRGEVQPLDDRHLPTGLETSAFLRLPDAQKFLDLAGGHSISIVATDGAPEQSPLSSTANAIPAPVVVHKAGNRANPLGAVIAEATRTALDPADWICVWRELVALANAKDRPKPLLGYVDDDEGLKYETYAESRPMAYLTREAFRKRFKRSTKADRSRPGRTPAPTDAHERTKG